MTGTRIRGVIPRNPQRSDEERKAFGKRLTKHVADIAMEHDAIADHMDVHDETIREWLAGRRVPHPWKLKRLAAFLGTTSEWLLTGTFAAQPQRRLSDLPGLYIVTRKDPSFGTWTSAPVPGTKAGLEKFYGWPGAKTNATLIGAL